MAKNKVGIVIGTKESSTTTFWIQVEDNVILSVNDIVAVEEEITNNNKLQKITFYGIVSNINKGFEGINFHSWNKETIDGIIPYQSYHLAEVRITRIEPDGFQIPPTPGKEVFKIEEFDETQKALNMDNKENLIPAGILPNGQPAYINWEFVNGSKGAHISISGVSGIATKTSYALFLIHSMLYSKTLKEEEKRNIRTIIFSVKGEDLLHIDKRNKNFKNSEEFSKLKIEPTEFKKEDIAFYLPPDPQNPDKPLTQERQDNSNIYRWSIKDFGQEELIYYMFDQEDREDDNFNYVLGHLSNTLKQYATKSSGNRIEIDIGSKTFSITSLYNEFSIDEIEKKINENQEIKISLSELLYFALYDKNNKLNEILFPSSALSQTKAKLVRKFSVCAKDINFLVVKEETKKINWNEKRVNVISISDRFLSNRAQRFVVGSILYEIYHGKTSENKVFIMIDELNKYAPATGVSPIKNILLDIAERGRSLGIILIGAQQMASEVDPRIIANASIKINGRLDPGEAEYKAYKYLTPELKERSKKIKSGTMILFQPDLEIPIVLKFPIPPYATRKEEVYIDNDTVVSTLSSYK